MASSALELSAPICLAVFIASLVSIGATNVTTDPLFPSESIAHLISNITEDHFKDLLLPVTDRQTLTDHTTDRPITVTTLSPSSSVQPLATVTTGRSAFDLSKNEQSLTMTPGTTTPTTTVQITATTTPGTTATMQATATTMITATTMQNTATATLTTTTMQTTATTTQGTTAATTTTAQSPTTPGLNMNFSAEGSIHSVPTGEPIMTIPEKSGNHFTIPHFDAPNMPPGQPTLPQHVLVYDDLSFHFLH